MPFPLIFHYFMHPPGAPRARRAACPARRAPGAPGVPGAGRADDKLSKGNEIRKEMTQKENGKKYRKERK